MKLYLQIAYIIQNILLPVLIICGFISNAISFVIMKRIKISATTKYMTFLALIDSCVLLIGGISFLLSSIKYNSPELFISIIACKLIPFLFYSFADYSVLIIVLMTFERFYAVWKPFKAKKMNKKRVFRLNILIGSLFCCLVNFHFLITHSLVYQSDEKNKIYNNNKDYFINESIVHDLIEKNKNNYICEYVMWNKFYENYWIYIDASVYSFVPSFLIITLNILIIILINKSNKSNNLNAIDLTSLQDENSFIDHIKLKRFKSKNKRYISNQSITNHVESSFNTDLTSLRFNISNNNRRKNNLKPNIRLIVMLMSINFSFCIFSMPMVITNSIYAVKLTNLAILKIMIFFSFLKC